jgi:4-hydroxy-tetrahydrodipicolinate synthase
MIAGESPLPVVLYNVPGRTGVNMSAETTLSLAEDFDNIIGVKEASGNFEQIMNIIQNRPEGFLVISGDDLITLPLLACGADGVISVVANAFPSLFSEMVRCARKDQFDKARKLHYLLAEITPLMFVEGNPSGIKAVLNMMDICEDHLRLPLVNVSKALSNKLQSALDKIQVTA